MAHRGPDGDGSYMHGSFGFIHKRLSILDVSGGAQPISNKSKTVHIIANGEIYNYLSLNEELQAPVQTGSDTESALYAYLKWGVEFPERLHGMYAIALFDEEDQTLYLVRDPFGIKPLYICETAKGVAFASEPAVFTKSGWVKPEVEESVLPNFFNRQYVGGEQTLFKGVKRMLPGEMVTIQNGEVVERKRYLPKLKPAQKVVEPEEKFDYLFRRAIQSHLQSDVPYGAFLSGGIDSSSMVTAMVEQESQPVRTYTVGFESETVADERTIADKLSYACKTEHTAVNFSKDDFWHYLPEMCEAMDDLVADYAALPLLKLSDVARKDVKVILSGEGGDELFAGYGRYRQKWWHRLMGRSFRGRGDLAEFADVFTFGLAEEKLAEPPQGLTAIQQRQWWDIQDWLPDDLLLKVDRCLMRYGIEGRVPYLDDTLGSFAFGLPDNYKVRGKHGKWLVKNWLQHKHSFMDVFAKKKGFTVPIQDWLGEKQDEIHAFLKENKGVSEITHADKLSALFDKPLDKKRAKLVFSLMCYAYWHQTYIAQ